MINLIYIMIHNLGFKKHHRYKGEERKETGINIENLNKNRISQNKNKFN